MAGSGSVTERIELLVISKLLVSQDDYVLKHFLITEFDFSIYKEEIAYIIEHYNTYDKLPSQTIFLDKFRDEKGGVLNLTYVDEDWQPLLDDLKKWKTIQQISDKLTQIPEYLQDGNIPLVLNSLKDIINYGYSQKIKSWDMKEDIEYFKEKNASNPTQIIPTGIPGLDDLIGGWQKSEEFVVFFARTGAGKTWMLMKSAVEAAKNGLNVGFISPEMSEMAVFYRFVTLFDNYSYSSLLIDNDKVNLTHYEEAVKKLKGAFRVSTIKEFGYEITVNKLRSFCIDKKLDILYIDGLKYIKNERATKNQMIYQALTEISEDLMALSFDLGIPVLVAVQANRGAAFNKEDTDSMPDISNIRDSDGISHNASKIIAMRQVDEQTFRLKIQKNRTYLSNQELTLYINFDNGVIDVSRGAQKVKKETVQFSSDEYEEVKGCRAKHSNVGEVF